MRNELLGYLLDALEKDEHERVDGQLRTDHQLRGEMELLRTGLTPLDADAGHLEPPPGLARRTVDYVFSRAWQSAAPAAGAAAVGRALPTWTEPAAPTRRWRMVDLSVAAGIVVAAFAVVLPAISQSRANAQRIACAGNMSNTYKALASYADKNQHTLPVAMASTGFEGKAGIYGPRITESGHLTDHSDIVCPDSELAEEDFEVPSTARLRAATGAELARLVATMGGSYAFAVGYWDESGRYRPLKLRPGERFPLMADLPDANGKPMGHHGYGRNVLFSDGSVKYIVGPCRARTYEDIYSNDDGKRDAGKNKHDPVLMTSGEGPDFGLER
jgi:anti-sigma-K factor RskA